MKPVDFIRVLLILSAASTALTFVAWVKGSPDAGALFVGALLSLGAALLAAVIESTKGSAS